MNQPQTTVKTDQSNMDDFEKANRFLALMYKNDNMIMKLNQDGEKVKFPLSTSINNLGNVGVGIQLYFKFLSYFAIVFFMMSLIAAPQMYYNYMGNSIEELQTSNLQLKLSLANQPQIKVVYPSNTSWSYWNDTANSAIVKSIKDQNNVILETYVKQQQDVFKYYYISDLAQMAFFFLAVIYFKVIQDRIIYQNNCGNAKMSDYAFKYKNFPEIVNDETDVFNHFSQFGEVIEAGLARKYYGCLSSFQKEAQINKKIMAEGKRLELNPKRSTNKLKILEAQKQKLNQKSMKKLKGQLQGLGHDEYPSLWGYVVFNDIVIRNKIYKDYKRFNRWSLKRIFCNCCWSLEKETTENYKLNGQYALKVTEIDQPDNILWENQEISQNQRNFNRLVSYFLVLIVLLITLVLIGALSSLTPSQNECTIDYVTLESQGAFIPSSTTNTETEMKCYCRQSKKINYYSLPETDSCKEAARQITTQSIVSSGVTIVILITNFLLKVLMRGLSKFEKYSTATELTLNTIFKIFVAQFINTAIVPLLLSSTIHGFNISKFFYNLNPALKDYLHDNSAYSLSDLNREWYFKIGQKVSLTAIIMIFTPHILQAILGPCINCLKSCMSRFKYLQIDMNNAILPQPFDLTLKYSQLLTATFVCLFYSTGMPFLNFVIFLIFISNYYFQKCILLRVSSQPIKYSQIISENVLSILPVAIIMKTAFSIWTLTSPDIFPIDGTVLSLQDSQKNGKLVLQWHFDMSQDYKNRMFSYYFGSGAFLLILSAYCSKKYIRKIIKFIFNLFYYLFCCCICNNSSKVADTQNIKETNFGHFVDEQSQIKSGGLDTYQIRSNRTYKDLVYALDFQEGDVQKFKQRQERHNSQKKPTYSSKNGSKVHTEGIEEINI